MKNKIKITIKKIIDEGQLGYLPYQLHSVRGAVTVRAIDSAGKFTSHRYEVGEQFVGAIAEAIVDNPENEVTITL